MDYNPCIDASSDCGAKIESTVTSLGTIVPLPSSDPNSLYFTTYGGSYNPCYASNSGLTLSVTSQAYTQGLGRLMFGMPSRAHATASPQSKQNTGCNGSGSLASKIATGAGYVSNGDVTP